MPVPCHLLPKVLHTNPHPPPRPPNTYVCVFVQAINTQEANKAASHRLPPLWAMVAMILLGWNEAMSILTSPVRLVRPPQPLCILT